MEPLALVGAAVWTWHWVLNFDAAGSVEGDRRRSPLWYLTVVAAGILPGLIAMLVSVTMMVSGVLIWFVGSTEDGKTIHWHNGSVGTFYAVVALFPESNQAVVIATNVGMVAEPAAFELLRRVHERGLEAATAKG